MKISFLIPAIVLCVARVVITNSLQVGTVLFTTTDLVKKCWSDSDKSLLRARLIMQDVLPDPDCIDFSKPGFVMILLDYFHSCYEIISVSTYGKIQNLMFLALSDALGGYLRAYVLPLTKRAYYAGQVKYSEAKKLFKLYDDIRIFLKTNGVGWAKPGKLCETKFRMKPLVMSNTGGQDACNQLYTLERRGNVCCVNSNSKEENSRSVCDKLTDTSKESSLSDDLKSKRQRETNTNDEFDRESLNNTLKCGKYRRKRKVLRSNERTEGGKVASFKKRLKYYQMLNESSSKPSLGARNAKNTLVGNETSTEKIKVGVKRRKKCKCDYDNTETKESEPKPKKLIIPLPVLDDSEKPNTIAVPFKNRPLRNLQTRSSAFVLERYYATVVKCLVSKKNSRRDIKNFNAEFHSWLVSQVCPHLSDETWYPAFGGILRIMETIKKFGAETTEKKVFSHDIGYMFSNGIGFNEMNRQRGKDKTRDVGDVEDIPHDSQRYFTFAVIIISAVWLFSFCACAFYFQATRNRCVDETPSDKDCGRKKNENFINLQFLIRFFKKKNYQVEGNEECNSKQDTESGSRWKRSGQNFKTKQKGSEGKETKDEKKDAKLFKKKTDNKHKGQLVVTGEGDVPAFIISNAEVPHHHFNPILTPFWPCPTALVRLEKKNLAEESSNVKNSQGDMTRSQNVKPVVEPEGKIETIWKKPSGNLKDSLALKDGRRDYSSEKTCCYSGSCSHSNVTSTPSFSQTQTGDQYSSSTIEYFQRIKGRHKHSTQESTEESGTEKDSSYSSESE